MRPEQYTDDQLRLAILDASDQRRILITTAYELEDIDSLEVRSLRTLLAHLPEPATDDWQECTFSQVSEHDLKVKVVWDDFSMEGEISAVYEGAIYIADRGVVAIGGDWKKLYRIPAPVVHPDPAEHPVIIVHLHNGVKETKRAFVWNGESYGCLDGPHSFLFPHQITEWSPAKVVADDE